jgi:hypothetical protein
MEAARLLLPPDAALATRREISIAFSPFLQAVRESSASAPGRMIDYARQMWYGCSLHKERARPTHKRPALVVKPRAARLVSKAKINKEHGLSTGDPLCEPEGHSSRSVASS